MKILDVKTTKYGRKKHPFTNRVGQHAETMRKMYRVHGPISASVENWDEKKDDAIKRE